MRQRGRIDEKSPSASDRCQPRRAAKKNSPPFERNRFPVPQQSIHLHDGQTRESSFPLLPGWGFSTQSTDFAIACGSKRACIWWFRRNYPRCSGPAIHGFFLVIPRLFRVPTLNQRGYAPARFSAHRLSPEFFSLIKRPNLHDKGLCDMAVT